MIEQGTVLWAVRWAMGIAGAMLAKQGIGDDALWTGVTGGVMALVPVVWSYVERRRLKAAAQ